MDEESAKLQKYREEVLGELNRRTERVRKLEHEIASQDFLLESADRGRRVLSGNTTRTLVQASYRSRLKRVLERLKKERAEAVEDVNRAEQRLQQVDAELEELEVRPSVSEAEVSSEEGE